MQWIRSLLLDVKEMNASLNFAVQDMGAKFDNLLVTINTKNSVRE